MADELGVLQLGNPGLRTICEPVSECRDPVFRAGLERLQRTLAQFRAKHGFGRAISAPQIGIAQRMIATSLPGAPPVLLNPVITTASAHTFTMWDDCMSFPSLLVRLRRHTSISLQFVDEDGQTQQWRDLDQAAAELLQHEIDHLDGVLAIDRALDRDAIVSRAAFDDARDYFAQQADYVIGAPVVTGALK